MGQLINGNVLNDVLTQTDVELEGHGIFAYRFGFSRKDLSMHNCRSGSYKATCLETESGTTGVTFKRNMDFVRENTPLFFFIENVPQLATSPNMAFLLQALGEAGYKYEYKVENSLTYGVHQNRRRL